MLTAMPIVLSSFFYLRRTRAAAVSPALPLPAGALRQQEVTGGPRGPHPYLLKSVSKRGLLKTGRDYQWSITFPARAPQIRSASSPCAWSSTAAGPTPRTLKTGNGLFGIRGGHRRPG